MMYDCVWTRAMGSLGFAAHISYSTNKNFH